MLFSSVYDNEQNLPKDYIPNLERQYAKRDDEGVIILDADNNTVLSEQGNRILRGNWGITEGLVYDEFTEKRNVIDDLSELGLDQFQFSQYWHHYCGIDFGYSPSPFACIWISTNSHTENGTWVIWQEHYKTATLLKKHAEIIHNKSRGIRIISYLADHQRQERAEIREYGIDTSKAKKDIMPGIDYVRGLIREGRLKVVKSCVNTIKEFAMYRKDDREFVIRDGNELPLDKDNHAMDAMRYCLYTVARGSELTTEHT